MADVRTLAKAAVFTSEVPVVAAAALDVIDAELGKLVVKTTPNNGIEPVKVFKAPPTLPIGVANELISGVSGDVNPVASNVESVDFKQFESVPSLI